MIVAVALMAQLKVRGHPDAPSLPMAMATIEKPWSRPGGRFILVAGSGESGGALAQPPQSTL